MISLIIKYNSLFELYLIACNKIVYFIVEIDDNNK